MVSESEFNSKQRRALFGSHADQYRDGRPGYPASLFEHLKDSCGLTPGCRVLEIGPGAGQATGPLLDASADLLAVEVGEQFGSCLRKSFDGSRFELRIGEFETVELDQETFDLVTAATSFHWILPEQGLGRVAQVLKPGGWVALWWNHYGNPDRADPFREAVQPILQQHAPQLTDAQSGGAGIGAHPYALDADTRSEEISSTGRFGPVVQTLFPWTEVHTSLEMQQYFNSFSDWIALDGGVRTKLLDAIADLIDSSFGGAVERPYVTALYSAQRI